MSRKDELVHLVAYHSDLYYNKGTSEITDEQFDNLVAELQTYSARRTVGAPASGEKKVAHFTPMGSINKAQKPEEVSAWAMSLPSDNLTAMWKYDGLALSVVYQWGKFAYAATRGDGVVGTVVSENALQVIGVPAELSSLAAHVQRIEFRGEVMIDKEQFKKLRESGLPFANERNAAAGTMMSHDPLSVKERGLSFVVYSCIGWSYRKLATLAALSTEFQFAKQVEVNGRHDEITKAINAFASVRDGYKYRTDGIVFALSDISLIEFLGSDGVAPRGMIAYKFPAMQRTTTLRVIEYQVGRTGKLTPVARLEPVEIDGSVVSNASLHNENQCARLGVYEGCTVVIQKANDIIPEVVRVVSPSSNYKYPTDVHCPSCGDSTQYRHGTTTNFYCVNPACPAQLVARTMHWINVTDMLGIGESTISELVESGALRHVEELYDVTVDQLRCVTGGSANAFKMHAAIQGKRTLPLATFLEALGIDGLGRTTALALAKKYKNIETLCQEITFDGVQLIDGVGALTATYLLDGFRGKKRGYVDSFLARLTVLPLPDGRGPLAGKSFVLTGSMSRPRTAIADAITKAGGEVCDSISRKVNYLVQADASSTSSKTKKAGDLGVSVISEAALWDMLGK